jgi:enoyl-CoA hydratase
MKSELDREEAAMSFGLLVERRGPVGWLIFDRPDHGNAFDADVLTALPGAWRQLDADPAVRAIVSTGNGAAFQTGLDMVALARHPQSLRAISRQTRAAALQFTAWHLGIATPVIAAVNGVCAGGGLHFVVDADIVIAAATATFLDPHVSVGQASNWEAIGLSRRMPAAQAARVALMGRHERLSAARAHQLGLVSELVEPARLCERAQEVGEMIAAADPERVQRIKNMLWGTLDQGLSASYARTAEGLD